MKYRSSGRRKAGFTLMELMVALVVIAFALFALISMILVVQTARQNQRDQAVAKQAAVSQLEAIKAVSVTNPPNYANYVIQQFTGSLPSSTSTTYTFSVDNLTHSATTDKKGKGTILFDSSNKDLLDATVTIEWNAVGGRTLTYSVRSLFCNGY